MKRAELKQDQPGRNHGRVSYRMSRTNWRHYLALGWLAPFVILLGFAAAIVISGGDLLYCKQPDARGSYSPTEPEKIAVPKPANDKAHCRDQSSERDNDCQSWRQAEAAEDQACIARRQFYAGAFIGLLGLLGLAGTVVFTKQAADGALRAADAAQQALEGLERPVLHFEKIEGMRLANSYEGYKPRVEYALKNYGRTPAVVLKVSARLTRLPTFPERLRSFETEFMHAVVMPGERVPRADSVDGAAIVELEGSNKGDAFPDALTMSIVFRCAVRYEGPPGVYREDGFCLRSGPHGTYFVDVGGEEYNYRRTTYAKKKGEDKT